MIKLFENYYNLFNWENGDNTCLEFTVSAILILGLITIEIIHRIRKHKSLFF